MGICRVVHPLCWLHRQGMAISVGPSLPSAFVGVFLGILLLVAKESLKSSNASVAASQQPECSFENPSLQSPTEKERKEAA